MSNDVEPYRKIAQEAVEFVFRSEYHNSLGLPLPKIEMMLADDKNYSTGQYYITIGQTWQIHLNFGKLPISYKEFKDEVKVLTRHEIEHYMCCPFDVITHLRMLKRIRDIYKRDFSSLGINIKDFSGALSNQVADIIVDTKNYLRYPEETLKSEINWIKKGADWNSCPRHSRLMFLTKEAVWGKSLEINETNLELIEEAKKLAEKFIERGIDDKDSFLDKTEEYAKVFFQLYAIDQEERNTSQANQQKNQQQSDSQNESQSGQQSIQQQSSSPNGQHNGQKPNDSQSNLQSDDQIGTNPQYSGKPKDGGENGSALVFSDPDKVKEALGILAEETDVSEFSELLTMAGLNNMSEIQKEKLWFSLNSAGMIPIVEYANNGNRETYTYPSQWKVGDPLEELDLMLSLMTSPQIIPGVTTKKWEQNTNDIQGIEKRQRDLLLVLDTSGSMKSVLNKSDNMHQAVLAAYGIISYFESIEGNVALIEFCEKVRKTINWTKNYDEVRESMLVNGQGGTTFPLNAIKNLLEESKNELVSVLITDGDLGNMQESIDFFRDYLNEDNKLYLFILGNSNSFESFEKLKKIGAKVYQGSSAEVFCNEVLLDIS